MAGVHRHDWHASHVHAAAIVGTWSQCSRLQRCTCVHMPLCVHVMRCIHAMCACCTCVPCIASMQCMHAVVGIHSQLSLSNFQTTCLIKSRGNVCLMFKPSSTLIPTCQEHCSTVEAKHFCPEHVPGLSTVFACVLNHFSPK